MNALEHILATIPVLTDGDLAAIRKKAAEVAHERQEMSKQMAVCRLVKALSDLLYAVRLVGEKDIAGLIDFRGGPSLTVPELSKHWRIPASEFATLRVELTGELLTLAAKDSPWPEVNLGLLTEPKP